MTEITDEQLMAALQSGDEDAIGKLIKRYEKELYNYLVRFMNQPNLAEEAFQEAFLQVYLSAESFDASRRFKPWLYTIATNKARDILRSQSRRPAVNLSMAQENEDFSSIWDNLMRDDETPVDILEREQTREQVREVVAEMPDNLRQIIILSYFKHMPYKEIAEMLDIPLGTVKSRLHTAVSNFSASFRKIMDN